MNSFKDNKNDTDDIYLFQRPRQPHYERAKVIAVTQPFYPAKERIMPCPESLFKSQNQKEDNQYETILAREVRNWFDHSQMIGIVHINPINGEDFFKARVAFHKEGMQLKKYGNGVMQKAIVGTKYEALMNLVGLKTFSTGFIFCPEHKKVNAILKILKKTPQMHLMCGILENQLLSRNEFMDYAKMPDIQVARSQIVNVLNMAGSHIVQRLESHQSNLVNILDAHVRVNQKVEKVEGEEEKVEEPEKS